MGSVRYLKVMAASSIRLQPDKHPRCRRYSCFGGAVDIMEGHLAVVAGETTLINRALLGEAGKMAPCLNGTNISQG